MICLAIRLDKATTFFQESRNQQDLESGWRFCRFQKFIQRRKRKEGKIMNPLIRIKTTVVVLALFSCAAVVDAQALRPLKPLPPKKSARGFAAAAALTPNSPWQ